MNTIVYNSIEVIIMGGFKDLTGQRFGRLIVIKKDGKDKKGL